MAISLASIRDNVLGPPRIVIYGTTGVGKTEFASLAPNPIFLATEDGLGKLQAKAWDIRSYAEVLEAINVLYNERHDFQTVVLDTADRFEPMVWAQVCATVAHEKGKQVRNIEDYGFGKGFAHAVPAWKTILDGFDALRDQRGMAVIVCAHAKVQTVKSPDSDDYEKFALRINDKAEILLRGWCDAMLFANYTTTVVDTGREDSNRHRALGTGKRVLYTEERPAFYAKNRYSLPPSLPFEQGQSWNTFVAAQAAALAAKSPAQAAIPPVTAATTASAQPASASAPGVPATAQ